MFRKYNDVPAKDKLAHPFPLHMDVGFDVFPHPDGACLLPCDDGPPLDFASVDAAIAHAKGLLAQADQPQ